MRIYTRLCIYSLICAAPAVFAADESEYFLDQYAPSAEERAGWQEARDVYESFVATDEFVGRTLTDHDEKIRNEIEEACTYNFKDCQAYILQNRSSLLRALPDNPLYWQRFWEILKVNPHTFLDTDDYPDYQRLIPATYWWFYRDIAQDGQLDIENILALQSGLDHWHTSHHTLIGRMMTIAMRGISLTQISYAMAQASRDRDEQILRELIQSAAPLPLKEISFGKTFWMEREFSVKSLAGYISSPDSQTLLQDALVYDLAPDQDPEFLRQFLSDPITVYKSGVDILARHWVSESTKPWNRYWSEGINPIRDEDFQVGFLSAIGAPAYGAYITTDRFTGFSYTAEAVIHIREKCVVR